MLPRLASSGTPAIPAPPGRRSAPARTAAAHRAPLTRPRRVHPAGGTPGTRRGGGGRGRSSPAQWRESTPTRKVRAENESTRQSPTLLFRRRGGWGVANSSQMSSGAEAQGLLCFQSLKSPASPPPSSPPPGDARVAAPSAPASSGAGAETGDGGKGRGSLALRGPSPACSSGRCRGSFLRPPPRLARVAI